ncbi:MAG: alginate lyase family protein [Bacteroidales bacterium]
MLENQLPVGVPDSGVIRNLRTLVENEPEASELWRQLQRRAESYLSEKPRPVENINYEGMLSNHPDRKSTVSHLYDMMRVEIWLSAWLITGDRRYEDAMRRYLLAWAKTYKPTGNPINENKLDPLLTVAVVLVDRLEGNERNIVLSWLEGLAEAEIHTTETMTWSVENNWHPKRLKIVALAAKALGHHQWIDWVVEETRIYIGRALRPDGSSRDFEQRDALSYHIGGVRPLLRLISLLPPEYREELYRGETPDGSSVARSVAFVIPYALGEKEHGEFMKTQVDLDRRRAEAGLEKYQPGRPFDPNRAVSLFQLAGSFEEEYHPLVGKAAGESGVRFYDWTGVLAEAGWLIESIEKEFSD